MPPPTEPTGGTNNPPTSEPELEPAPTIQSTSYDVYHDSVNSIPKCTKADLYTNGVYVHTEIQPTLMAVESNNSTITGVIKNRYAFYDGSIRVYQNDNNLFPHKLSSTATYETWSDFTSYEIQNRLMVDNVSYKNIYINNNIESPVVNNYTYQIYYPTIAQNDSSTYHYCKAWHHYSDNTKYLSTVKQTRTALTNATTMTGISKKQYKYTKIGGGDVVQVDKYNQPQSIFPYIDSDGSFFALIPGGTINEFWIDGTSYKITSRLMIDNTYKNININNNVESPTLTQTLYEITYNSFSADYAKARVYYSDNTTYLSPKLTAVQVADATTITGVSRSQFKYKKLNSTTTYVTEVNSWDGSVKSIFPYVTHLSYGVNPSRTIQHWSDNMTYTLNT